jgi:hypothetical protein
MMYRLCLYLRVVSNIMRLIYCLNSKIGDVSKELKGSESDSKVYSGREIYGLLEGLCGIYSPQPLNSNYTLDKFGCEDIREPPLESELASFNIELDRGTLKMYMSCLYLPEPDLDSRFEEDSSKQGLSETLLSGMISQECYCPEALSLPHKPSLKIVTRKREVNFPWSLKEVISKEDQEIFAEEFYQEATYLCREVMRGYEAYKKRFG